MSDHHGGQKFKAAMEAMLLAPSDPMSRPLPAAARLLAPRPSTSLGLRSSPAASRAVSPLTSPRGPHHPHLAPTTTASATRGGEGGGGGHWGEEEEVESPKVRAHLPCLLPPRHARRRRQCASAPRCGVRPAQAYGLGVPMVQGGGAHWSYACAMWSPFRSTLLQPHTPADHHLPLAYARPPHTQTGSPSTPTPTSPRPPAAAA